jgi:hypothetical protein
MSYGTSCKDTPRLEAAMLYQDRRRIARDRIVDAEMKMLELRTARRQAAGRAPALAHSADPVVAGEVTTTRPAAGAGA